MGVYAKENGQGMMFDTSNDGSEPPEPDGTDEFEGSPRESSRSDSIKRPSLRLVK
jgi:stringent starvation protein B